jgi:hypothetical protein
VGRNFRSSATGTWGWLATDGGFGNTLNSGDAVFRTNANEVVRLENPTQASPYWTSAWPSNPNIQPGAGQAFAITNAPWNSWTSVEVESAFGMVTVKFNGTTFFSQPSSATTGFAIIGYEDPFTGSGSWQPDWSWGLFDNIQVVAVPEPSSMSLVAVAAALGVWRLRRRHST